MNRLRNQLLTLAVFCCLAASAHMPATAIKRIICFTKLNSVKVEASFDELPASGTAYSIRIEDQTGHTVYDQPVTPTDTRNDGHQLVFNVNGLQVTPWMPTAPVLYQLTLTATAADRSTQAQKQRIGFRIFESKDGNLYLNNHPIFLRGIAINPPERGIPRDLERSRKFAEDYVHFMKSIHVNIIRIPDDETWYDVCDELGMMVFGGNYSGTVDGEKPPRDYGKAVRWYEDEKFAPIAHHPALMIYAMTNEVDFAGALADPWRKFLSYAHEKLRQWDDTRCYIGNAGYGYGRSGDICDLHRYWGWYYCSPFTFLNIRNNDAIIPFKKPVQPVTFTECVGNYTGPDGRYNLTPDHKNPGSQLNWTGHADERIQARLANEHQCLTFRMATELFRRLRSENHELSGVFPFTILFYNWNTVTQFVDMGPKPVTAQARLSYQPVLLSWECWTTQVYGGNRINPVVHIVNDDDAFQDLINARLVYQLLDETKSVVYTDSLALPDVRYYDTWQKELSINIPQDLLSGKYQLAGKIIKNGKTVSENYQDIFVGSKTLNAEVVPAQKKVWLYDPAGKTASSFNQLSLSYAKVSSFKALPANSLLVIGENGADQNLVQQAAAIKQFVQNGGRILCLRQDVAHLPNVNNIIVAPVKNVVLNLDTAVYPPPPRPSRNGYYVNPERPDHPVFAGIEREQLRVWSDYTGWNESKPGFPAIYPITDGFVLQHKEDIRSTAVIGNYDVALQSMAITEMFSGKGSVLLCAFDLAGRTGLDPVADRLLLNMMGYMGDNTQHQLYQLVDAPITWGNYTSEKGLITGVNSGLLLNSKPVLLGSYASQRLVLDKQGNLVAGQGGGFNTRPGLQYIPYGRRPFGPYNLRGFGNVPDPDSDNNNIGAGGVWCRIPAGKRSVSTIVWNPDKEAHDISMTVNGKQVTASVAAGGKATVTGPVDASTVHLQFSGDRRLVLMQTFFK